MVSLACLGASFLVSWAGRYGNLFGRFTASSILKSLLHVWCTYFPGEEPSFFPCCPMSMDCHEGIFRVRVDVSILFSGISLRIWWGLSIQPFVPRFPGRGLGVCYLVYGDHWVHGSSLTISMKLLSYNFQLGSASCLYNRSGLLE